MDIKDILAKNVKLYRSRLGYTQKQLADVCSQLTEYTNNDALADSSYISDIENSRRNIALDKVELLSKALNVEPYQLFLTKAIGEKL